MNNHENTKFRVSHYFTRYFKIADLELLLKLYGSLIPLGGCSTSYYNNRELLLANRQCAAAQNGAL